MFTVEAQTIQRQNHQVLVVLDLGGGTTSIVSCVCLTGYQRMCGSRDRPFEKASDV